MLNIILFIILLGYITGCFEGLKYPYRLIALIFVIVFIYNSSIKESFRVETKESCKSKGLEFDPVDKECVKSI
jgi:hypothetical protein